MPSHGDPCLVPTSEALSQTARGQFLHDQAELDIRLVSQVAGTLLQEYVDLRLAPCPLVLLADVPQGSTGHPAAATARGFAEFLT
jgi:hypothetical protein